MKATRRSFLGALAASSLPAPVAIAASDTAAPTIDELRRYYGFLWCELRRLSNEIDVEMCDAYTLPLGGGSHGYEAAFGHRPPSHRAKAVLSAAGGCSSFSHPAHD